MRIFRWVGSSVAAFGAIAGILDGLAAPTRAQEQIDPTVGTVGQIVNDGPLPADGFALLGADPMGALKLAGRQADAATVEAIDVTGQPFTKALRVKVTKQSQDNAVLLSGDLLRPLKPMQTVYLRVYARLAEGGTEKERITLTLHAPGNPQSSAFFGGSLPITREWKRLDLPTKNRFVLPAGSQFSLRVGGSAGRTIEVGGVEVYDFGTRENGTLPYRRTTYEGRAANAAWRKAAMARIETMRKANMTVRVVDAKTNKPVSGATVALKQINSEFRWGTAINWNYQKTPRYREEAKRLFNEVVIENSLKWGSVVNPNNRAEGLATVAMAHADGLPVRGHCVIWPGWGNLPPYLRTGYEERKKAGDTAGARAFLVAELDKRIETALADTKGMVSEWDMVNETVGNHDLMDILGREAMAGWYKRAKALAPDVRLMHCENSVENGSKIDHYLDDIKFLRANGATVDGMALQGHLGAISIETIEANLNRATKETGLPFKITEFDMNSPDDALQADFTRDVLTLVYSLPAAEGFLMWGFWDGAQWLGDAPIFYKDWTMKPSGKVYEDLVLRQWRTNANIATDSTGKATVRGHRGTYDIAVTDKNGKSTTLKNVVLGAKGANTVVKL